MWAHPYYQSARAHFGTIGNTLLHGIYFTFPIQVDVSKIVCSYDLHWLRFFVHRGRRTGETIYTILMTKSMVYSSKDSKQSS